MAPELIKPDGMIAPNRFTDIWSVGCTVYEIVVGRPPWSDEDDLTLLR